MFMFCETGESEWRLEGGGGAKDRRTHEKACPIRSLTPKKILKLVRERNAHQEGLFFLGVLFLFVCGFSYIFMLSRTGRGTRGVLSVWREGVSKGGRGQGGEGLRARGERLNWRLRKDVQMPARVFATPLFNSCMCALLACCC